MKTQKRLLMLSLSLTLLQVYSTGATAVHLRGVHNHHMRPGLGEGKSGPGFCHSNYHRMNTFYTDTIRDKDTKFYEMKEPQQIIDPITCEAAEVSYYHVDWFRESVKSSTTGASLRQRTVALAVAVTAGTMMNKKISCLSEIKGLSVWNTESKGAVHDAFEKVPLKKFEATEFFGAEYRSGELVRGVQHQDLQNTSFPDETFDLVISTEVFEHIPHPYKAHREVYRVLKPGGAHVFTNPFIQDQENDLVLSKFGKDGTLTHTKGIPGLFDPPIYHGDPIRPEGVLAFTYFGWEEVRKLCGLGFEVDVQHLQNEKYGIVGQAQLVFIAWKK